MFDGFELERVHVGEAELRVRHGGSGLPLVLLHGHPRARTSDAGDPIEIRRTWAPDVRGALSGGHHLAEAAPEQIASTLRDVIA